MKKIITLTILFLLPLTSFCNEEVKFSGTLIINESKLKASFELVNEKDRDNSMLKIQPEFSRTSCYFRIKRITAPQQIRGRHGVILSNKAVGCVFMIPAKEMSLFWNNIGLIDLNFSFNPEMILVGKGKLSSVEKNYSAVLKFN